MKSSTTTTTAEDLRRELLKSRLKSGDVKLKVYIIHTPLDCAVRDSLSLLRTLRLANQQQQQEQQYSSQSHNVMGTSIIRDILPGLANNVHNSIKVVQKLIPHYRRTWSVSALDFMKIVPPRSLFMRMMLESYAVDHCRPGMTSTLPLFRTISGHLSTTDFKYYGSVPNVVKDTTYMTEYLLNNYFVPGQLHSELDLFLEEKHNININNKNNNNNNEDDIMVATTTTTAADVTDSSAVSALKYGWLKTSENGGRVNTYTAYNNGKKIRKYTFTYAKDTSELQSYKEKHYCTVEISHFEGITSNIMDRLWLELQIAKLRLYNADQRRNAFDNTPLNSNETTKLLGIMQYLGLSTILTPIISHGEIKNNTQNPPNELGIQTTFPSTHH